LPLEINLFGTATFGYKNESQVPGIAKSENLMDFVCFPFSRWCCWRWLFAQQQKEGGSKDVG